MSDETHPATGILESPAEDSQPRTTEKGSKAKASAGTKRPNSASSVTWTEDRVNAPSRQTVGMLSLVAGVTLVMWAAGRAACNYHEPGESLSPREVSLEDRTRTVKDVAFELQQRWLAADFSIAEQLVAGELAEAVAADRKACGENGCRDRKEAQETIFSVAEVLKSNSSNAFVRVRSVGAPAGDVTKVYELERIDSAWKAVREFEPNQELPPLKEPPPTLLRSTQGEPSSDEAALPGAHAAPGVPAVIPAGPSRPAMPGSTVAPSTAPAQPSPAQPSPAAPPAAP